jgi:hypothetical protein
MAFSTDPPHILSADEIFAAKDIEERTVDVPQWGGAVRIRTFSKRQATDMSKRATVKDRHTGKESVDNDRLEALLFAEGIIEPKFTVDDYEQLQEKSAVAISVILRAIMDASGLSEAATTEAIKSASEQPDDQVRVSSGARAQDDTGGTLATDVGL